MSNFEISLTHEDLTIPDKCKRCPKLALITDCNEKTRKIQDILNQIAASSLGGFEGVYAIDPQTGEPVEANPEFAEYINNIHRESLVEQLEDTDRHIEEHKKDIGSMTEFCGGPVKLRGSRDGKTYTVTACSSLVDSTIGEDMPNTPATVRIDYNAG